MAALPPRVQERRVGLHTLADLPSAFHTGMTDADRKSLAEFYKFVEQEGHFVAVQEMLNETSDVQKMLIGTKALTHSHIQAISRLGETLAAADAHATSELRVLRADVERNSRLLAELQSSRDRDVARLDQQKEEQARAQERARVINARTERMVQEWNEQRTRMDQEWKEKRAKQAEERVKREEIEAKQMAEDMAKYRSFLIDLNGALEAAGLGRFNVDVGDREKVRPLFPKIHELLQQNRDLSERVTHLEQANRALQANAVEQANRRENRFVRFVVMIIEFVRRFFQAICDKVSRSSVYQLGQHVFTYRNCKKLILKALAVAFLAIIFFKM